MIVLRKTLVHKCVFNSQFAKHFSVSTDMVLDQKDDRKVVLSNVLNKSTEEIENLLHRRPKLNTFNTKRILEVIDVCKKYSIDAEQLFNHPKLFGVKPTILKHHADVLKECGFNKITPEVLLIFVTLVSKRTIKELKSKNMIYENVDVQERLLKNLNSWPTSPAMSKMSYSSLTLHTLRMKILARYLELSIDLPEEEFERKIITYPRIKHRPFKHIDKLLDIFQHKIGLTNERLCSYFGIFQSDPNNIDMMLENIKFLSGISLRNFINNYPSIVLRNWENVKNVQEILNKNGIPYEAQRKCPKIYALDDETVIKRIEEIKKLTEFHSFTHHPKITKLIYSKNKADLRLNKLKNINKTCISINVLSGCELDYLTFAHSQGDVNRGRDAKSIIQSLLDYRYSYSEICTAFKEPGCLTVVPLENLKTVHDKLKDLFSCNDIFRNCHVLVYPWENIKKYLEPLLVLKSNNGVATNESVKVVKDLLSLNVDVAKMSMSAVLSLVLYFIEKEYNFNGGGIWTRNKNKKLIHI